MPPDLALINLPGIYCIENKSRIKVLETVLRLDR